MTSSAPAFEHEGDRFERIVEIGRGGMGVVHRARDRALERDVAVKTARFASPAVADGSLARFIAEAQITSQLTHPGIVPIHDIGVDSEGRLFYAMQWVQGEDLSVLLDQARFPNSTWTRERLVGVLLEVCEALTFAHDLGVIHRDLKPANVRIGQFGETYVMDWGLARIALDPPGPSNTPATPSGRAASIRDSDPDSGRTLEGDVVGTPAYMSPEQASGAAASVGPQTDVYAAGVMLYEILTKRRVTERTDARTPFDVLALARDGRLLDFDSIPRDVPPQLVSICRRATQTDPARRTATMRELRDDLRAYLEGRVVRSHRSGPISELLAFARRNRAATVAGVVGVGAIIAIAWFFTAAARLERDASQADAERVLRLADLRRVANLRAEFETLWPSTPQRIGALENWLTRAATLSSRRGEHRRVRESVANDPAGRFLGPREWWLATLDQLLTELDALAADDPFGVTIANVTRRLEFARSIEKVSLEDEREAWDRAANEIRADSRYGGLRLSPQLGLVPLGSDPVSGLQEFWHVESGSRPVRDLDRKGLVIDDSSGIVLVLIPGGETWIGCQTVDPAGPNFDPLAASHETPPLRVVLDPFFIGKHEVTQAQWARVTGMKPSHYDSSNGSMVDRLKLSPTSPVESITWHEANRFLDRIGLTLPTRARFEVAQRGGESAAWSTGSDPESLRGYVNIADRAAARGGATWKTIDSLPGLDDGFPVHAAVNTLLPNRFGLHHMAGNVEEWCLDLAFDQEMPRQPGNGAVLTSKFGGDYRPVAGGCFWSSPNEIRNAVRKTDDANSRRSHLGLRAARDVEGLR